MKKKIASILFFSILLGSNAVIGGGVTINATFDDIDEQEKTSIKLPKGVELSDEDRVLIDRAISSILLQSGKKEKEGDAKNIYQKVIDEGIFLPQQSFVLGLLSKNADKNEKHILEKPVFSDEALYDLEIFQGRGDKFFNFSSKINNAETLFGKAAFARLLCSSTNSVDDIKKRQAVSYELSNNEHLFNQVENVVADFKNFESDFISLWNHSRKHNALNRNSYYLNNGALATISKLLLPKKIRTKFFNWVDKKSGVLEVNFPATSFFMAVSLAVEFSVWAVLYKDAVTFITGNRKKQAFGDWANKLNDKFDQVFSRDKSIKDRAMAYGEASVFVFKPIVKTFGALIFVLSIRALCKQIVFDIKSFNIAHKQLTELSFLVYKSLNTLQNEVSNNEVLARSVPGLQNIETFLDRTNNKLKDLKTLLGLLKKRTFKKDKKSILFSFGRVLAAYKLLDEVKDDFINVFEAVGELDAYLFASRLIKDSDDKTPYCFAEFLDSDASSIKLKSCWNPLLDPKEVVTNDITIGSPQKAGSAIITGPNAGGKSTLMKSIAFSILMAQSFGVAPAKEMEFTPFSYVDTHMAKTDDISKKQSSYMAEALHVKKIVDTLTKLPADKFGCVFMDELFNTTNPQEAPAIGLAIGKFLAKQNNVSTIISSHYSDLTKLEEESDGVFKNYHVTVDKNPDGSLLFPFKVVEGKTTQSVALDILDGINMEKEIVADACRLVKSQTNS
jgi:DNA mismatch repair protein MutS